MSSLLPQVALYVTRKKVFFSVMIARSSSIAAVSTKYFIEVSINPSAKLSRRAGKLLIGQNGNYVYGQVICSPPLEPLYSRMKLVISRVFMKLDLI